MNFLTYNRSLQTGTLPKPKDWKEKNPGNYRPISLTAVACKVLETFIRDNIVDHMVRNNFFSDHQHGFTNGISCTTQLLACLDAWTDIIDQGRCVDVIYLDFQKAFDKVPHERLKIKLKGCGIPNQLINWISDFLERHR